MTQGDHIEPCPEVAWLTARSVRAPHRRMMDEERSVRISKNLVRFLRANVGPGQEVELALNKKLEQVIVFRDGEPILNCTFDDIAADPGGGSN